jgi:hypothetical protein
VQEQQPEVSEKLMKNDSEMEDDLRAEYDLKKLQVRRLGSGRQSFGGATVRLEPMSQRSFLIKRDRRV